MKRRRAPRARTAAQSRLQQSSQLHRVPYIIGFKGILALDDIHLNSEMKQWWKEVQDGAERGGYHTYDISEIGHISGTGLVDFSGKVTFKK